MIPIRKKKLGVCDKLFIEYNPHKTKFEMHGDFNLNPKHVSFNSFLVLHVLYTYVLCDISIHVIYLCVGRDLF